MLDDLIEFLPFFSGLESVDAADGQKTLQAGVDRVGVVGRQQLQGDVQEARPLFREIMLQDLLKERDQLRANVRRRRGQGRDQPLSESGFLLLRDRGAERAFFDRGPATVDSVFQVDTGYKGAPND